MFAAASSFFSRTNISQNYVLGGSSSGSSGGGSALSLSSIGSRSASSTPAPSAPGIPGASNGTNGAAAITPGVTLPHAPTFRVGPWRVQSASHKSSGKRVSIWDLDKKAAWLEKLNPSARERAMEVLKAEVGFFWLSLRGEGS
jgi:SCY1-like protein 2